MAEAISNTSPFLYLHRIGGLDWLPKLFREVRIPNSVLRELHEGRQKGYEVPNPTDHAWCKVGDPRIVPSEWLTLDLGAGELAVLALGLENASCIVLLDDGLARRIAQAAGLTVWGTLKVLLESKARGLVESIGPLISQLQDSGMWVSDEVRPRVLALAGEK
jgi:predicted nucleic acid-binding protein